MHSDVMAAVMLSGLRTHLFNAELRYLYAR